MIFLAIILLSSLATLYFFDPFWKLANQQPEFPIKGNTVTCFGYLLQYDKYESRTATIAAIRQYGAQLIVMEPTYTTQPASWWTKEEIQQIKTSSPEKILIAYVSIGDAESYREYWNASWDSNKDGAPDQGAPAWLDRENPDWKGNYKVKYWDPEWQSIIFGNPNSMIDRIMTQGFDGICMDIIDAFEYYFDQGIEDADKRMVDFVQKISNYTKSKQLDFLIVPQNGEALAQFPEYL